MATIEISVVVFPGVRLLCRKKLRQPSGKNYLLASATGSNSRSGAQADELAHEAVGSSAAEGHTVRFDAKPSESGILLAGEAGDLISVSDFGATDSYEGTVVVVAPSRSLDNRDRWQPQTN